MSIQIMSAVWQTPMPTHTLKLVLLSLADQANDHGSCWPSITGIAERCDLSRQAVLDQIGKLKSLGLLKVEKGGGRRSNRYVVAVNRVDQKSKPVAVNAVDPSSQPGGPQQSTPLTPAVNAVDPIRNRTVKKPPSKQVRLSFVPPSLEQVSSFCRELGLPQADAEWFFYKCDGNGWTNGGKPIQKWKSTIQAWKAAGYLPSQKKESNYGNKNNAGTNPRLVGVYRSGTDYGEAAKRKLERQALEAKNQSSPEAEGA